MDVKSAFLYGTIEEEVYVCQPPGFEDPDYPDKKIVFKWERLIRHCLSKGKKGDILLVQIYVDDINFGSTNKDSCRAFEKLMKDKFQMSSMGELTFFLGLQVKQKPDGIFISQDKYVAEILRKFGLTDRKSASTPIGTKNPLLKDPDGEDVDVHTYKSIIGSLMYLNSSRLDIMFAVCVCARFQVTPKVLHLHAVKRIFRYLKGKPHLGLWYPKDSPFNLVAYSDSDYVGAILDRKSTTGGCQFLGCILISWQCKKQTVVATSSTEAEYVAVCKVSPVGVKLNTASFNCADCQHGIMGFVTHTWVESRGTWGCEGVDLVRLRTQVGDLTLHTTKYSSPALTQKVFANIRMVGKGFSVVETPLFEGMIVVHQADDVADEGAASVDVDVVPTTVEPSIPSPTPTIQPPLQSQELPSTSQVIPTPPPSPIAEPSSPSQQQQQPSQSTHDAEISLDLLHTLFETCTTLTGKLLRLKRMQIFRGCKAQIYKIDLEHADKVLSMQDDELELAELQEVVEVVTTTKLMTEVVTAASAIITVATTPITAATMTNAPSAAKKRKGVVIRDPEETVDEAYARKLEVELSKNINWDDVIEQVQRKEKEDNDVIRYQALKRKLQTEAQAKKNMMIYLRNMAGFKIDYFNRISYDDIRLIFVKYFNSNVAFLEKTKEQMEEEESRALKRASESQAETAAKKQKLDEEVEELKRHL
uniref:Uncharacterized mitochondrial protein AtMg00810-like n=1 Tax=Tanacetum cinerariifolium TaxID=118510 RepID=A0A6L2NHI0_TANCI|nr:uncharacterized mitochondrial protein AtMg00810-like [Tanacetum cinerariifolium]